MHINELLTSSRTLLINNIGNKRRCLSQLSTMLSNNISTLVDDDLLLAFLERERLGSTAIGHGVALPHIRSDKINHSIGALIYTKKGIEFDSPDSEPVDLFFALIVPTDENEEHLKTLAHLAQVFSREHNREILRQSQDSDELYLQACDLGVTIHE